jgi:Ca-activated chloride channel family protein
MVVFKDAWILFLIPLAVIPFYIAFKRDASSSVQFSSAKLVRGFRRTPRLALARHAVILKAIAAVLFVVALARPRIPLEETRVETEGIDIVLAIDSSGSMLAEDFTIDGRRHNRLEVVKRVVEDFIRGRRSDRIGMVTFAARAYTVCPLTLDYDWLITNLERVRIGNIEDGTAVGSAITASLNRLEDTRAKSKVVILLTDGINNAGRITPLTAAEAARALGIKIYTIGAGSKGPVPFPAKGPWGETVYTNVKIAIDEKTLRAIAQKTGGRYFRATDTESLREIYKEIDRMEKTHVEETGFLSYRELYSGCVAGGLLFFVLWILVSHTIVRKIP